MAIAQTLIIFLSFVGFIITFHIYHKQRTGEKLVCFVGRDCDAVIKSEYASFLGVANTIWGMIYFSFTGLAYLAHIVYPQIGTPIFILSAIMITSAAFLFSIYLIFIQMFALRQWCEWCLLAGAISALIFFLAISEYNFNLLPILAANKDLIVMIHTFAAAIGVGAATIADVFFFKFLKDFRISEEESNILKIISNIIWVTLAAIVLSGLGLYLPEMAALNNNPKFLVKVIGVIVLILNGAVLNLIIAPRLINISFGAKHRHTPGELHLSRKFAFALGAISITSWYFVFFLGAVRQLAFSFSQILSAYLALLIFSVLVSQFVEIIIEHRSRI
jgi:uncharacterized membrane protein